MALLTLTLDQPTLVGDRARSDFVRTTNRHLPGAVVRGAFAAAWIARHGDVPADGPRREEFLHLFEGGIRFGPLFRTGAFVPLSVRRHKYGAGPDCPIEEIDLASAPETAAPPCAVCGNHFGLEAGLPPPIRAGEEPQVYRRTGVTITASGAAERGALHSRDVLTPGQPFTGHVVPTDLDIGGGMLDRLLELAPVRLGGRVTTHGRAHASIRTDLAPEPIERRSDGRLVIRLRGPAVFVDRQGRPIDRPRSDELRTVLGTPAHIEQAWVRWESIGGWHAASGLPKPPELAVAPGSTYVLRTEADVTDEVLASAAARGLGLRRHEGFGDLGGPYRVRLSPIAQRQADMAAAEQHRRHQAEQVRPFMALKSLLATPDLLDDLPPHVRSLSRLTDPAEFASRRSHLTDRAEALRKVPHPALGPTSTMRPRAVDALVRLLQEPPTRITEVLDTLGLP